MSVSTRLTQAEAKEFQKISLIGEQSEVSKYLQYILFVFVRYYKGKSKDKTEFKAARLEQIQRVMAVLRNSYEAKDESIAALSHEIKPLSEDKILLRKNKFVIYMDEASNIGKEVQMLEAFRSLNLTVEMIELIYKDMEATNDLKKIPAPNQVERNSKEDFDEFLQNIYIELICYLEIKLKAKKPLQEEEWLINEVLEILEKKLSTQSYNVDILIAELHAIIENNKNEFATILNQALKEYKREEIFFIFGKLNFTLSMVYAVFGEAINLSQHIGFHSAAKGSLIYTTKKLIIRGAYVDFLNEEGQSALEIAVNNKNLPMIVLLLSHNAIIRNPMELIKFLSQCDLNSTDVKNAMKILFSQEKKSSKEKTALELFVEKRDLAMINLLLNHDAIITNPTALLIFLNKCNQNNPDVENVMTILYLQQKKLFESKDPIPVKLILTDTEFQSLKACITKKIHKRGDLIKLSIFNASEKFSYTIAPSQVHDFSTTSTLGPA